MQKLHIDMVVSAPPYKIQEANWQVM